MLEIQRGYLQRAWARPIREIEESLPARYDGEAFHLQAFGEPCEIHRQEILLGGEFSQGAEGILVALYASFAKNDPVQFQPLKAFRQFPGGMSYQAAFAMNAERVLIPYVESIQKRQEDLVARFSGRLNRDVKRYDFSFTLYPLPKIPLYYLFNLSNEEFPASVTCLFGSNADHFLPIEGLADTAEYTAKKIITLITEMRS
jgi:hypothetical protein